MSHTPKVIGYTRAPETRGQSLPYQEKFEGFLKAIQDGQAKGADTLLIATPWVIGDTYEEVLASLTHLAAAGLALQVIQGPEEPVMGLVS